MVPAKEAPLGKPLQKPILIALINELDWTGMIHLEGNASHGTIHTPRQAALAFMG